MSRIFQSIKTKNNSKIDSIAVDYWTQTILAYIHTFNKPTPTKLQEYNNFWTLRKRSTKMNNLWKMK